MESKEIWKDIEGFEGLYQISNLGRVKSLGRYKKHYSKLVYVPECIRKPGIDKDGYEILPLNKKGNKITQKVHRLVAQAFIPNPDNKNEIDHIDCNKRNNKVTNLRWVTRKENVRHSIDEGHFYHPSKGYIYKRGEMCENNN